MKSDGVRFKDTLNIVLISGFIIVGCVVLVVLLIVRPSIRTNPEVSQMDKL